MKTCSLPYVTQTKVPAPKAGAICDVRRDTRTSFFPAGQPRLRLALAAIALLGYSGVEAQTVINNVTTVSWEGPYYDVSMAPCGEMDHYTIYLMRNGMAAGKSYTTGSVHEITFTNLAPGTWHFQVQAIDRYGRGSALSGGWKELR